MGTVKAKAWPSITDVAQTRNKQLGGMMYANLAILNDEKGLVCTSDKNISRSVVVFDVGRSHDLGIAWQDSIAGSGSGA